MKLKELFGNIQAGGDLEIKGITNNSNEVKPGYLFIAVKGTSTDGNLFVEDAVRRGAVAVISESEYPKNPNTVFIRVRSGHDALWQSGKIYYGDPSSKLDVVGITGTNGKTTVSYLIKNIFKSAGIETGVLGTIDYVIGDRKIPAPLTTPDVLKINQYMSQMLSCGCKSCVMEISSHALEQGRVDGINFKAGIFTNLGRDHLDYHKTIDSYLEAKAILFNKLGSENFAIVNLDDPYSGSIVRNCRAQILGYGITAVSRADIKAKIKARGIQYSGSGTKFSIYSNVLKRGFPVETKFIGNHNVYNILAAAGAAMAFNIPERAIREGVFMTENVPGRLEKVEQGQSFDIFIDFAHTPDALESVLFTMRRITKGKIILVFGCGGNRDKEKRPLMGRIAGRLADYTFITSDNPRKEEPIDIINDIKKGFVGSSYKIIADRRDAINEALSLANEGDTVLIAGKGHENYQILKETTVSFSDKAVVEEMLKERERCLC